MSIPPGRFFGLEESDLPAFHCEVVRGGDASRPSSDDGHGTPVLLCKGGGRGKGVSTTPRPGTPICRFRFISVCSVRFVHAGIDPVGNESFQGANGDRFAAALAELATAFATVVANLAQIDGNGLASRTIW